MRVRTRGKEAETILGAASPVNVAPKLIYVTLLVDASKGTNVRCKEFPDITVPKNLVKRYRRGWGFNTSKTASWVQSDFVSRLGEQTVEDKAASSDLFTKFVIGQDYQYIEDVVTRNASAAIARGAIINNPMKSQKVKSTVGFVSNGGDTVDTSFSSYQMVSSSTGRFVFKISFSPSLRGGDFGIPESIYQDIQSMVISTNRPSVTSAVNMAYGNVNSADLDALVSAAEAHKTLAHLASTVTRLARIILAVKRGKFSALSPKTWKKYMAAKRIKPTNVADFVQDAWLEARYAWRPLVYDANGIAKIVNGEKATSRRSTFRGGDNWSTSTPFVKTFNEEGWSYEVVGEVHTHTLTRAGVIGESRLRSDLPGKLGIFNVAEAAWDLVPFSFVANWFIDISSLLYRLNPQAAYNILASWSVSEVTSDLTANVLITSPDGAQKSLPIAATGIRKDREPNVRPVIINVDLNLDRYKLLDAIAILRSVRS